MQTLNTTESGFSLLEIILSIGLFSVILTLVVSYMFWLNSYYLKSESGSEVLDSATTMMNEVMYEIRGSEAVYTPTTTSNQLSLETTRYLPTDATDTYIDFFLCQNELCLKREGQSPIQLSPPSVQVTQFKVTQIQNGSASSVEVSLTVAPVSANGASPVTLTSTAEIRNY